MPVSRPSRPSSIYHNAYSDRHYRAATGLSLAEFDALYTLFEPIYTPKIPAGTASTPLPVLTDKREALFFILHYFKAYPTLQNLGTYFGISDASASNYLELLKPCLKAALQQQRALVQRLFTTQESFEKVFEGVEDLFIDVTEISIERPENQEIKKECYSGKKNSTP